MSSSVWGGPLAGWISGGGGGLADVGQDLCDGLRVGEERDERERRLAGWTNRREDFIGPGQPVQELESRETQRGTAGQVGPPAGCRGSGRSGRRRGGGGPGRKGAGRSSE